METNNEQPRIEQAYRTKVMPPSDHQPKYGVSFDMRTPGQLPLKNGQPQQAPPTYQALVEFDTETGVTGFAGWLHGIAPPETPIPTIFLQGFAHELVRERVNEQIGKAEGTRPRNSGETLDEGVLLYVARRNDRC